MEMDYMLEKFTNRVALQPEGLRIGNNPKDLHGFFNPLNEFYNKKSR